eukprot:4586652-Amphidinium_carterae.1
MDVHQCTGFMVNAQRLAGRLQLWSHGSWTTQAQDLELNERDEAWHQPSFLHFQSVGIPPGYRRRSAAAVEARNQKFRERNKASNRWGGQASGNPSSSASRWGGRDEHFQERWSGYGRTSSSSAPRPSSSGAAVTRSSGWSEKCAREQSRGILCACFAAMYAICIFVITRCASLHCSNPPLPPLRCFHVAARCLCTQPKLAISKPAEAVLVLAKFKVVRSTLTLVFCLLATAAAMGSQNGSASSTPSHLFQERHTPSEGPQVVQGASYHPMSDLYLIDQGLELFPQDAILLADRARLIRQAHRLWQLHNSGAIPPLSGQVTLELTLVLGLAHPEAAETLVFPYVDRQSRKRALHVHTVSELQTNAEAAEARHRRRQIAPAGHARPLTAEAVKRRRRILPPKRGRWNRALSQQRKNLPLAEDPIEEFSQLETPGLSSTDVLPAAGNASNLVSTVEAVISDPTHTGEVVREADTLVDSTNVSSSALSPTMQDRQTGVWPELAEEEELSSGNSTVSTFSTECYDAQARSPLAEEHEQPTAEAVGHDPSMSCVVSSALRARAISVASHSDDDDNAPLTHLVNGTDHISPLLLVSLLLLLQVPSSWLAWWPAAVVASPLLITKAGLKRLQRRRRLLHSYVRISVQSMAPKHRPVHRFAGICIGEASNPGPARQSTLSFSATLRDGDDPLSVPMQVSEASAEAAASVEDVQRTEVDDTDMDQHTPTPSAEAAVASEVDFRGVQAPTEEIPESVWLLPSTESNTPDLDAPRGMNDPAPVSRRQRRSHDVRPAEAGRTHPQSLPQCLNKIQLTLREGERMNLHCNRLKNGSYQWKFSSGVQRYAKTAHASRGMVLRQWHDEYASMLSPLSSSEMLDMIRTLEGEVFVPLPAEEQPRVIEPAATSTVEMVDSPLWRLPEISQIENFPSFAALQESVIVSQRVLPKSLQHTLATTVSWLLATAEDSRVDPQLQSWSRKIVLLAPRILWPAPPRVQGARGLSPNARPRLIKERLVLLHEGRWDELLELSLETNTAEV